MENQQAFAEQLFGEALDLPREERAAFLAKACRDAPAVQKVVSALLEENDKLSGYLSDPPYQRAGTAVAGLAPGTRLGRYTIVDQPGAGGMGVVYRARDEKLERQVAIKMVSKGVLASVSVASSPLWRLDKTFRRLRDVTGRGLIRGNPSPVRINDPARSPEQRANFRAKATLIINQ